jgi:SM-20-related protein
MTFHLNPSLDTATAGCAFAGNRYVQIRDVFPDALARTIHATLVDETPWNLVFNDRGRHIDIDGEQLASIPPAKRRELDQAIYAQARNGFQYCYMNYPIFDAYRAGLNKDHLLHRLFEWLNGDEFLTFARTVTNYADITNVDAQATRFLPGHFLSTHDDIAEGKKRRAAYILNFTPEWSPDWGGYLQLLADNGDVRIGLKPAFNRLNIIDIPQPHNVSLVTPFAAAGRYAITGWLRYA